MDNVQTTSGMGFIHEVFDPTFGPPIRKTEDNKTVLKNVLGKDGIIRAVEVVRDVVKTPSRRVILVSSTHPGLWEEETNPFPADATHVHYVCTTDSCGQESYTYEWCAVTDRLVTGNWHEIVPLEK